MITITSKGNFKNTENFLSAMSSGSIYSQLEDYGAIGVEVLNDATPKKTGETAESWYYTIDRADDSVSIFWSNDKLEDGIPVVILLQYGHVTGTGGYVQGRDFINPAILPVFDKIAHDVWKAVKMA